MIGVKKPSLSSSCHNMPDAGRAGHPRLSFLGPCSITSASLCCLGKAWRLLSLVLKLVRRWVSCPTLLSVARSGGEGIFPLPMPSRVRQGGQDQLSSTLADKVSSVMLSRDLLSPVLQLVGDKTSSSSCCSQGGVDQTPCTPIFLVFSGNRSHRYQHRPQLQ